jgi:hypothetical protein
MQCVQNVLQFRTRWNWNQQAAHAVCVTWRGSAGGDLSISKRLCECAGIVWYCNKKQRRKEKKREKEEAQRQAAQHAVPNPYGHLPYAAPPPRLSGVHGTHPDGTWASDGKGGRHDGSFMYASSGTGQSAVADPYGPPHGHALPPSGYYVGVLSLTCMYKPKVQRFPK